MLRHLALAALLLLVPTTLVFGQEVAPTTLEEMMAKVQDQLKAGTWDPNAVQQLLDKARTEKGALEVQVKALEGRNEYREMYDELCRDLKISKNVINILETVLKVAISDLTKAAELMARACAEIQRLRAENQALKAKLSTPAPIPPPATPTFVTPPAPAAATATATATAGAGGQAIAIAIAGGTPLAAFVAPAAPTTEPVELCVINDAWFPVQVSWVPANGTQVATALCVVEAGTTLNFWRPGGQGRFCLTPVGARPAQKYRAIPKEAEGVWRIRVVDTNFLRG